MYGGKFALKIDWTNLILGRKFTVFLCFPLYLRAISKYKAPGGYIWRGNLTEGFLRYEFGGLIFEGAYTWRIGSSAWESRDWDFKVSKMADFFKRVISSRNSNYNTDWKHPLKTFELLQFFAESTSYKLHKTLLDGEFFFVDKPVRAAKSASAG